MTELDWWQHHTLAEGHRVTATPAQHWSNRLGLGRNAALWSGFHLHTPASRTAWFAGDTGYHGNHFKEVGRRCGPPDLAMIPIGAYEPRWFMRDQHCNPAEAVQIHQDCGARQSVAMHWGTFQLTDEGREQPVRDLSAALVSAGLAATAFRALAPGESVIA